MPREKKQLTCVRCGHIWEPLVRRGRPKQCPSCRSRAWWKPYERPLHRRPPKKKREV